MLRARMNDPSAVHVAVAFAGIAILAVVDALNDLWIGAQPSWIDLTVITGAILGAAFYGWQHLRERRLDTEINRRVIAAIAMESDQWSAQQEAVVAPPQAPVKPPTYRN